MKRKAILLVVATTCLLSSATAFARLGETPDQCQMRYGTSNGSSGAYTRYYKDHFDIAVLFRDGKSFEEIFSPNGGSGLTEAAVAELLAANSDGAGWSITANGSTYKTYLREDGDAHATLSEGSLKIAARFASKLVVAPGNSTAAAKDLPARAKNVPAVAAVAPPTNRATQSESNPDLMRRMGFSEKEIAEAQAKR